MITPSSTRLALPEKIAITMSEELPDQSVTGFVPMTTAALLRRLIFFAETLYDLETMRRPYTPTTAVRFDRTMEALTIVVDELARRTAEYNR
jgi:hypothetical protein